MSSSALLDAPITADAGVPVEAVTGMRFAVQIAVAGVEGSVLGTMILGTSVLTDLAWVDVTADVHGVRIERGSRAGSRPGIGQLDFRLQNSDGAYHPYVSTYYGPGTLVRVVLSAAGVPDCLITVFTIEWAENSDADDSAVKWVDVTGLETLSLLGEIDNAEQALQGLGEFIAARTARILDAAGWQLGPAAFTHNDPTPPHATWGFQSTNLATNALGELYQSADSVGMIVHPARNGGISVVDADFVPGVGAGDDSELGTMILGVGILAGVGATFHLGAGTDVPVVFNSVVTANDDERLLDHISVSREGGTQVTYSTSGLAGRWQTRSTKRTDLVTQNPGGDADLARYATLALAKGRDPYRVRQFKVDTAHGVAVWSMIRLLDIGTRCYISRRDTPTETVRFNDYPVCGYTLDISRQNEHTVRVQATVETDVGLNSTWEII